MQTILVRRIKTPTRDYIEIQEPGGQVMTEKIELNIDEAISVYYQLGSVLEKLEVADGDEEQR